MRIQVVKLKAEHFEQLLAQKENEKMRPYFNEAAIKDLEAREHSYSIITATGRVIFCGGLSVYWHNRCEAWGVFDHQCREYFVAIHKAVVKFLNELPVRRVEATTYVGFAAGHRWLKLLGFTLEAPLMRAYSPAGADLSLYAKVRGEA